MTARMTVHKCPHCRCVPDEYDEMGKVDKAAPFYSLVALCDGFYGELAEMGAGLGSRYRDVHRDVPQVSPTSLRKSGVFRSGSLDAPGSVTA